MRGAISLFTSMVLTTAVYAAPATDKAPMGLALYSDACVNPQSTDLMGERIGVLRLNRGHDLYIFYQDAEGAGFSKPEIFQPNFDKGEGIGPNISFTIDWGGKPETFQGTITDKMIVGQFSNPRHTTAFEKREFHLPRVSLDQKGYPDCR